MCLLWQVGRCGISFTPLYLSPISFCFSLYPSLFFSLSCPLSIGGVELYVWAGDLQKHKEDMAECLLPPINHFPAGFQGESWFVAHNPPEELENCPPPPPTRRKRAELCFAAWIMHSLMQAKDICFRNPYTSSGRFLHNHISLWHMESGILGHTEMGKLKFN